MTDSILITGGTGFFGQGMVKHLFEQTQSKRIIVYSRDEYKQSLMRRSDPESRLRFFVGDVRDRERLRRAFEGVEVVIHAAALKRIETCHYNPSEMVKTNILGSLNVIEAAQDAGVKKVIALSTDKSYQPVSAYGYSKALMESIFLSANNARGAHGPIYSVTRYGNVSGSTGSIIPKWRDLIVAGAKSVPVTDPDCTRFWMTQQEAVYLVLDTMGTMKGGELNVPILPAYRIGDLAEAMGVGMEITGLPEFEKKHEGMADGNTSDKARMMSVEELRNALKQI